MKGHILVSELLSTIMRHQEDVHFMWCKNCERILGVFVGVIDEDQKLDANDPGCPICGDNAAKVSRVNELVKRWPALFEKEGCCTGMNYLEN